LKDLRWVADCAVAHEQVVEHFTGKGTVIPFKLFTLFTTDQRALDHINETRENLDAVIKRVIGRQEWGVRLRLKAASGPGAIPERARPGAAKVSGTQFLLLKKKAQDQARLLKERAVSVAEGAYQELARYGEDARRLPSAPADSDGRIILDAAFLVPLGKAKRFREAVKRLSAHSGRMFTVTLTGPWPPYNFIGNNG